MNVDYLALGIAVQAGVPVLIEGLPGIGKTAQIRGIGKSLDCIVEEVIASIHDPSDFSGLPFVNRDGVKTAHVSYAAPDWAVRLADAGKGILFLDELSTAAPAVQAALLRVVLDRWVGSLKLPPTVSIIAAMNPPETGGCFDLTAPMANRFCHMSWGVNLEEWQLGVVSGFRPAAVPTLLSNWSDYVAERANLVQTFLGLRPNLLHVMPTEENRVGKAWPSPRSWEMAWKLWAAADCAGLSEEVRKAVVSRLMSGCVGTAALEFLAWVDALDLVDPEELLNNPDLLDVTARGDKVYASLNAMVYRVLSNNTTERWELGWKVLASVANKGKPDLAAFAAKALANTPPPGTKRLPSEIMVFKDLIAGALNAFGGKSSS